MTGPIRTAESITVSQPSQDVRRQQRKSRRIVYALAVALVVGLVLL